MTDWHLKSRRKASGGIRNSRNRCDKKLAWKGGKASSTLLSDKEQTKIVNGKGKTQKVKLYKAATAMVSDKGKVIKAKILAVRKNIANRHFERRQVITKGAVIEVEFNGKIEHAIVTNRPGQKGEVQAKLLAEKIDTSKPKKAKKKETKPKKAVKPIKKPKKAEEK